MLLRVRYRISLWSAIGDEVETFPSTAVSTDTHCAVIVVSRTSCDATVRMDVEIGSIKLCAGCLRENLVEWCHMTVPKKDLYCTIGTVSKEFKRGGVERLESNPRIRTRSNLLLVCPDELLS